ncbi:MAG: MarR family winged helix-turn-helix transcriptional regulator [Hyphomonadaceae bacterium]
MSSKSPAVRLKSAPAIPAPLILERFLPYRLSILSNRVSRAIAGLYERQFALTIPEWRVVAVLARKPGLTAGEIAEKTEMDKVAISRAVARLVAAKRLIASADRTDARRQKLALSARGHALYERIAPLAGAYEARLLEALTHEERRALDAILDKLALAALKL